MKFTKVLLFFFLFSFSLWSKEIPVNINFQDLEIKDFIVMVSKITNKNILAPINITGKVNFISNQPLDKKEVYDLLISVLRSKGFTLIDTNNGYFEITKSDDAAQLAPSFSDQNKLNQIQTDILAISNVDANLLLPQIKILQSNYGKAVVSKATNTLVLTDYPKNLSSIRILVKKLDSKEQQSVQFFPLEFANSAIILPKIEKIINSVFDHKLENQKVEILQNEGSNTLIVIAKKEQFPSIIEYIKALDKKDEIDEQQLSIIALKNSDAITIVKTLDAIIASQEYKKDKRKPKITSNEETNSLIIISSQKELEQFQKIIDKLDVDRQQVYVQARIIEINDSRASEIGAKYGIFGGMSSGAGLYTFSSMLTGKAIPIDVKDIGISLQDIKKGLALGATIALLNTYGAADILSEPSLLCINNLESSIYVGQTESIISQTTVGSATTDLTKNSYTRQDIGLTLTLKPRISTDNKVTLDVKTVLEDVVPGSQAGLPTTTKREVKTTAIVRNGESIIIGGLIKEKRENDESKIPLLGDIPLLGKIFTYDSKSQQKVSLVVILTPYIISNNMDLGKLRDTLGKFSNLEKEFASTLEIEK